MNKKSLEQNLVGRSTCGVAGCEAMESSQNSLWQKIMSLNGHVILPAFLSTSAPSSIQQTWYVVTKDHSVLRDPV